MHANCISGGLFSAGSFCVKRIPMNNFKVHSSNVLQNKRNSFKEVHTSEQFVVFSVCAYINVESQP